MGTITIRVDVFGGKVPDPIVVVIDNLSNDNDHRFSSWISFEQNFDLKPGNYLVRVSSVNPKADDAYTEISVKGNCKLGPLPDDKRKTSEKIIRESFYLEM